MQYIDNVKVYEDKEEREIYVRMDDWVVANGYETREELKMRLLVDGCSEDEISDAINQLEDEFSDWCDEHDVIGDF